MIVRMLAVCHRDFYLRQCRSEDGDGVVSTNSFNDESEGLLRGRLAILVACFCECKHEIPDEVMHLCDVKFARATQGVV